MKNEVQCDYKREIEGERCPKTATCKWGDHWFCDEHGRRIGKLPDTVTIPRELFEQLTEAATELLTLTKMHRNRRPYQYRLRAAHLSSVVAEAVKIRDNQTP